MFLSSIGHFGLEFQILLFLGTDLSKANIDNTSKNELAKNTKVLLTSNTFKIEKKIHNCFKDFGKIFFMSLETLQLLKLIKQFMM